jgi:hypothetical protein
MRLSDQLNADKDPLYALLLERYGDERYGGTGMSAINALIDVAYDRGWWDSRITALEDRMTAANKAYDKAMKHQLEASK